MKLQIKYGLCYTNMCVKYGFPISKLTKLSKSERENGITMEKLLDQHWQWNRRGILTHLIATPIARIYLNITETIKSELMNTNARRF